MSAHLVGTLYINQTSGRSSAFSREYSVRKVTISVVKRYSLVQFPPERLIWSQRL